MSTAVTIVHIIVCLFLMLVVLLQAGKGGGMGAAFGGGGGGGSASGSVFGGSGAGGFLRKLTVLAATVFMLTSMTLAYLASSSSDDALKRLSAKSRIEQERKEKAHFEALGDGAEPEAEDGADAPESGSTEIPEDMVPPVGTDDPADPPADPSDEGTDADTAAPDDTGEAKGGDTPAPSGGASPPPAGDTTSP